MRSSSTGMKQGFVASTRRAACLALLSGGAALAATPTELRIGGAVTNPVTLDAAGLAALPPITQTVTFQAGNVAQTHTYTGASLWSSLSAAGIVVGTGKNDILDRYVLATGADGYRTVFSLGELNPGFGNRPDLIAYAETNASGATVPLASDGFARITAPGDLKGGRYVSNLVDLDVRDSGSSASATGGGPSTRFSVTGAVQPTPGASFALASLQALPATTLVVGANSFTGVSFWDLLNAVVGLSLDPTVKNDVLDKYVVATGSDGYRALFSLGELEPSFGHQPDLIAYAENGALLGTDGFARLVVPNDVKAGRWVSNLVSLEVFTAAPVPEPGSVALMSVGLGLLVLVRRRRPAAPVATAPSSTTP